MNELFAFLASAVIIEGLVSYAGMIFVDKHVNWQVVGAIALGILISFNLTLDFFEVLGIPEAYPVIGTILTGILISRGSNYVYDLYKRLIDWKVKDDAE